MTKRGKVYRVIQIMLVAIVILFLFNLGVAIFDQTFNFVSNEKITVTGELVMKTEIGDRVYFVFDIFDSFPVTVYLDPFSMVAYSSSDYPLHAIYTITYQTIDMRLLSIRMII